eukprot:g1461.t1
MSRPVGNIVPNQDLVVRSESCPTLEDMDASKEEVLVHRLFLSIDPAMRGWMRDLKSYVPPVQIGDIMRGSTINEVVASTSSKFRKGDIVLDSSMDGGWSEYAVVRAKHLSLTGTGAYGDFRDISLSSYLGVLGGTGLTAYFGMTKIGHLRAGETVLVSGAAGATGSVACQIALARGCKVVGIAGGSQKCEWLCKTLHVDHAIDYKSAKNDSREFQKMLRRALKAVGSKGFDVFFDNVGGMILDEVLRRLNRKGRVVVCGAISAYNAKDVRNVRGIVNYQALISLRASMQGFIVFDYVKEYPRARRELIEMMRKGTLVQKEDIRDGLYSAPYALLDLFSGGNRGKMVVRVGDRLTTPSQRSRL